MVQHPEIFVEKYMILDYDRKYEVHGIMLQNIGGIYMFKILEAEQLSASVYKQVIHAPRVAKSCEPGQFIIVRVDETAERIPLTICDYDREAGTVTLAFQPIGV